MGLAKGRINLAVGWDTIKRKQFCSLSTFDCKGTNTVHLDEYAVYNNNAKLQIKTANIKSQLTLLAYSVG